MEKQAWIERILNSTNGITQVNPHDTLFAKIQEQIKKQNTVSPKTVWLVAASIAILVFLNISVISKSKETKRPAVVYFEMAGVTNNQLYQ